MKHLLLTASALVSILSPLAASAAPVKVLDFEAKTQLSSQWERPENRKLIETRMKLNHTNMLTGEFFESPFAANVVEIQKYSDQVRCATGEKTACRVKAVR